MSAALFHLSGKLALVTGAGSGLGLEFSRGFAASGAELICADRDSSRAEEAAALIRKAGGRATPVQVDVAEPSSVQALADRLSRVDVLVNNAGVSSLPNRVHELPI